MSLSDLCAESVTFARPTQSRNSAGSLTSVYSNLYGGAISVRFSRQSGFEGLADGQTLGRRSAKVVIPTSSTIEATPPSHKDRITTSASEKFEVRTSRPIELPPGTIHHWIVECEEVNGG